MWASDCKILASASGYIYFYNHTTMVLLHCIRMHIALNFIISFDDDSYCIKWLSNTIGDDIEETHGKNATNTNQFPLWEVFHILGYDVAYTSEFEQWQYSTGIW